MKCVEMSAINIRKVSLATVLIALGVVISPFTTFPVPPSLANPTQHLINSVSGVLLGPFWAGFIAFCIGIIRMSFGIGTILSLPGGIPGGMVVGLFYWLLKKYARRYANLAALTDPIGTLLIGLPLAVYIVAPWANKPASFTVLSIGWFFSCVPGTILGFIIIMALKTAGFTRETFSK
jgi:energy coupling factor transporter S component ThiW